MLIVAAGDDLKDLNLDTASQVDDEHLGIGDDTWVSVAVLEEEHDPKPFYSAVRKFYPASLQKMIKKFPFGDPLMKNLEILHPDKTASFSVSTVVSLAKRFPQLGLSDAESLRLLCEEFMDFTLSPSDLPSTQTYNACDHTKKVCAGPFWWQVGQMKTMDGKARFGRLYQLMSGLLCIPSSNADAERGFSVLRKVHTDERSSLNQSSLIHLMSIKSLAAMTLSFLMS